MKIDKTIDVVLALIGIGSAVGVAFTKAFIGGGAWELPLLATCTASMALMLTKQQYQWREYSQKIEGTLSSLITVNLPGAKTSAEKLVHQLLQSFTFSGSPIDDGFWVRYGQHLLDKAHDSPGEIIDEVLRIKQTNKVIAGEGRYNVMRMLFQEVSEYRGIADYAELKQSVSEGFIFETPVTYGRAKYIERLFLVPDLASLKRLSADKRLKLRDQINYGVQLRWLKITEETPDESRPDNFGIYGNVAVGIIERNLKANVIHFDENAVRVHRNKWDTYWAGAIELTLADFPE